MSVTDSSSPRDDHWVAIDLETTGLSQEDDEIIEIGAVRFHGDEVVDTFHSFVNPNRRLSDFTRRYTGITQADVNRAPTFPTVAPGLASFIGATPLVGHNVGFDLGFLKSRGMELDNERCDTWDLAYVLMPGLRDYSLRGLSGRFGVAHLRPHRAVEDAMATRGVFLALLNMWSQADPAMVARVRRIAAQSPWVLSYLLDRMDSRIAPSNGPGAGMTGFDAAALSRRLQRGKTLRPSEHVDLIDVDGVVSLLEGGGPLSRIISGFEEREEQISMARAVAEAINRGSRLIVEAGTGVGKSMAYLLPSLLHASQNSRRVVISTNTINLQEQLLTKDLPGLADALEGVGEIGRGDARFCQLKGRANYLCLRRWHQMTNSGALTAAEARLASKALVWLDTTDTGDRSELNLGHPGASAPWDRLSAQGAVECPRNTGPCFLRAARDRAAASHVIVVNHALLLSDLVAGGGVIPEHDVLIVDEAHHLEEEATRHLGFALSQSRLDEHLRSLSDDRSAVMDAVAAFRGSTAGEGRRATVERVCAEIASRVPVARQHASTTYSLLAALIARQPKQAGGQTWELRITSATRAQPHWSDVEIGWQNLDISLIDMDKSLEQLALSLEGLEDAGLINYERLTAEVARLQQESVELRQTLTEFVAHPRPEAVYWITQRGFRGDLTIHAAPLQVGETLEEQLFSKRDCVVMTSATLGTQGSFDHIVQRTGFSDAEELMLGSPFDYPRAAMLCVPDDMPEPSSWAYQAAVEQAITDAVTAVGGRTMALFTSHASIQTTAKAVRGDLLARGINVLAQGIDGRPAQLLRRFVEEPSSLLLGTSSFWEGVDLAGESLKVLIVLRLPFSVPTDPLFAARSELYADPFNEYAVPQAVLRLRQGFGRLIRTRTDRGVAVILDRRITSRRYGREFLASLPDVELRRDSLHGLSANIREWMGV